MKAPNIKNRIICLLLAGLLALASTPTTALAERSLTSEGTSSTSSTATSSALSTEPELTEATSAIITDSEGNVLWSYNANEQMSMASITKIMTAIVALDSGFDLDDECTIYETDYGSDSQTVGFTTSDTPTMRELLRTMLVYSGNDAAYNVAVNVAGSEEAFVELMNEKAEELGLTGTHYANPHGLADDENYSCAADLVVLGRYALENYPFIASTVRLRSVTATVGGVLTTFQSTDDLMDVYDGLIGIKTGYLSGNAAFLGACQRDGVRLYTCVLGCSSKSGRFTDTQALLDWAYESFAELEVGSSSWVVDARPYACNFGLTVVTRATSSTTLSVWPGFSTVDWSSTMTDSSLLLDPGLTVGSTTYTQEGRLAGTTTYETTLVWGTVPSVGVLQLPLYLSTAALGVEAQ